MMNKAVNLIKMIILIQANPGISAQEIMAECQLQERTFYRYMSDLGLAGINISYDSELLGYRYHSNFGLIPIDLSEDEAVAFGLHHAEVKGKADHNSALKAAFHKILASISQDRANKSILASVQGIFRLGTSQLEEQGTGIDKTNKNLEFIFQAILEGREIEVTYLTQSRDEINDRILRPFYLVPRNNNFYLIAYCTMRQGFRIFRVSRFQQIKLGTDKFDKSDYSFSLNEFLDKTWSIEPGKSEITFKVKFNKSVARYIKEESFLVEPVITDTEDRGIIFEVTVKGDREFLQWLNQYGADAEILEPASYREKQREKLEEWLAIYQGN